MKLDIIDYSIIKFGFTIYYVSIYMMLVNNVSTTHASGLPQPP